MTDWSPLGGNPVPGDPGQVSALARNFHGLADDIETQTSLLRALRDDVCANGVWEGPAADAFRPHLTDLPDKLTKAVTSYREAGDALGNYAPKLQQAQDVAVQALAKAADALRRLNSASAAASKQEQADRAAAQAAVDQHKDAPDFSSQHNFSADASQARADLQAAYKMRDHAVQIRDDAAKTCASALSTASHDGIRNKHHHWWDSVIHVLKTVATDTLRVVSIVANTLSVVTGILALVLAFTPLAEFAPALELASIALGGVGMLADAGLAAMDEGKWSTVLVDGVALGLGGLGHGLGGAALKGAEAATEGEKLAARGSELATTAQARLAANEERMAASQARLADGATRGERLSAQRSIDALAANRKAALADLKAGSSEVRRGLTKAAIGSEQHRVYFYYASRTSASGVLIGGHAVLRDDYELVQQRTLFPEDCGETSVLDDLAPVSDQAYDWPVPNSGHNK